MNLSLSSVNSTNNIESESNVTFSNMSYSFLADTSLDMSPTNEAIHPTLPDKFFDCKDHDQEGENDECFMNDEFEFCNDSDLLSAMNGDAYSRDEVSEKDVPVDVVDTYLTTNPEHGHASTSPDVYNDLSSSSCSPDIDSDSVISSRLVADDFASLEGYIDDLSLGENRTNTPYVSWTGELLLKDEDLPPPPNYVEGSDVKELLRILSEERIPPRFQPQIVKLHPAEEELIVIMWKNNLPIKLYKELLDWAHRASTSKYDFSSPTYQTTLDRMRKKYLLEAGTSPLRSSVEVEGGSFAPMHVYRFSILHQVKQEAITK